jgi:hypothetical protein
MQETMRHVLKKIKVIKKELANCMHNVLTLSRVLVNQTSR